MVLESGERCLKLGLGLGGAEDDEVLVVECNGLVKECCLRYDDDDDEFEKKSE